MSELNPRQFREVTNMKATPGSQGTLFQGGNPTGYHRGYTPERQRQVRGVLHPDTAKALRSSPETRAIVGTVMRSTVPPEGIRNVHFTPAGNMGRQRGMRSGLAIGGMYSGGSKFNEDYTEKTLTGRVQVAAGEENTTTPIHELGHHQSRLLGRQSSEYNTVARRGADEGFAETFAERNFRDRRGRPATNFTTNPLNWSSGMNDASRKTFAKHFNKEREDAPSVVRTKAKHIAQAKKAVADAQQGELFDLPPAQSTDSGLRILHEVAAEMAARKS